MSEDDDERSRKGNEESCWGVACIYICRDDFSKQLLGNWEIILQGRLD